MIMERGAVGPLASGPGDILFLLRRFGPHTRGEIQKLTGLSRMTLTSRIASLMEHDLVVEGDCAGPTGGRRATQLVFNKNHGYFAIEAMETTRARTAITDMEGRVVALTESAADISIGPRASLDASAASIENLAQKSDIPMDAIQGIGLSLPGPIDPFTQRPAEPPIMPGWDDFGVAEYMEERLGKTTVVENDANAMALGAQRLHYPKSRSLVLIKAGTGIGSGFVVGGDLYEGVDGGAGDIGHVRVPGESNRVCRCGSQGCLAALASGWAVASELAELGYEALSGHDVRALLEQGDVNAARLVQEAGRHIGFVGASVVSMFNPDVVVLAGDMASTPLLGGFREVLYSQTLPRATKSLSVVVNDHPEMAIHGMSQALGDRVFAAQTINTRVST